MGGSGSQEPWGALQEESGDTLGSDLAVQPSAGLKVTPVEGPTCGVELWGSWNFQRVLEAWVEEGSAFKAVLWSVGIPTRRMCSGSLGARWGEEPRCLSRTWRPSGPLTPWADSRAPT
ncbi:unnamed protein product [Rangifer tarandus platyrhynchus]|uniref:Uncharacterized protein n=1 Tax=Rangifer tarandus platyrhynchus TaxID=3082113 RepID=A0AC59ZQC0_RANTA